MKPNNNLILCFLSALFSITTNAQNSNIKIDNPEPMQVCNLTTTTLKAQIDFTVTGKKATILVELPEGITYIAKTIKVTQSNNAGLKIKESNITNLSKPIFEVQGNIAPSNHIEFTMNKTATCSATNNSILEDKVTVKLGNDSKTETSNSYTLTTPNFGITPPDVKNDAVPFKDYTRSFTIINGGSAFANVIYLDIEYAEDINQSEAGLRLGSTDGAKITPSSVSGKIYHYAIKGALLGADKKFTNGETLIFYEDYNIKACNTTTTYNASWGCDDKKYCQTTKATTEVNLITGIAQLGKVTFGQFDGFVNSCTPFGWSVTYTNTGTSNLSGAMYNTAFLLAQKTSETLIDFDWTETNVIEASVDGIPVPGFKGMKEKGVLTLDFADKLTKEQVKGHELGLRDLDGDGFVDDLPAGASITINFKMQVNCNRLNCNVVKDDETTLNNIYELYGRIDYTTICGEKKRSNDVWVEGSNRINGSRYYELSNTSYSPANVYDGVPFEARFSVGHDVAISIYDTKNTRYYYQLELPPGVSLVPNSVKWHNGKYPENIKATQEATIEQKGNILTITPKDTKVLGYFIANFIYKCTEDNKGGKIEIPFKLKRIDDIVKGCTNCNSEVFCGELVIENAVCPLVCDSGPTILETKVERADNSLGYTTYKLEELQKRENISAYDLSKALYLDDIEITAKAKQGKTKNDLFLKFSIKKNGSDLKGERLQAKGLKYTITRANDPKSPYKGELSLEQALKVDNNTKEQVFRWDFTSILPNGQILAGDEIETIATYNVVSNDMLQHDVQTGKEIYFYNTDSGGFELFCNTLTPEMYLTGYYLANSTNSIISYYLQGCETRDIGGGLNYFAIRFDSQGIRYQSEVRPGIQPKTYSFTLPDGLVLEKVYITKYFDVRIGQPKTEITESVVRNGSTYTYTFPEDEGYAITITNVYNFVMYADVRPTCVIKAKGQYMDTELTYWPHHYHNKPNGIVPEEWKSRVKREVFYLENTRPKLDFINQSGVLHGDKEQEEVKIRMESAGTTTAPFVWFAVPAQGINVLSLKAGSKEYTPLSYGDGGVWFRIDEAGLGSGEYKDFTLTFTHNFSNKTDVRVLGGWNCTGYPVAPDQYTCGAAELKIPFEPLETEIELLSVQQPTAEFDLCTPQTYMAEINNKAQGRAKNANLTLSFPKGMTLSAGSFSVEYPKGSGVWVGIAPTISGQDYTFDISKHKNYPKNGIPGTYSTTDNNQRAIIMRWDIETCCDFVSGSTFIAKATAKTGYDRPAKVSNIQLESISNNIKGATADYQFISDIKIVKEKENCGLTVEVSGIVSGKGTTNQAQLYVTIPKEFAVNHFEPIDSSHQLEYMGPKTLPTGERMLLFNIPKGMKLGNNFKFQIIFDLLDYKPCGEKDFKVETHEKIEHILCDKVVGGYCQNITTITSKKEAKLSFDLPILSITKIEATAFDKVDGFITVKNTGKDQTNPTVVYFLCADKDGQPIGEVLHSVKFTEKIERGKESKKEIKFAVPKCASIVALIRAEENCMCSKAVNKVFTPQKYKFEVSCPTFKEEKVNCYGKIPTQATYTKEQFEKLGDGKGRIGKYIQHSIAIIAENEGTKASCNNNKVTRVYTVIEYQDTNKNKIYDKDKDKIVNKQECKQIFVVNDNVKPVWVSEPPKDISVGCPGNVPKAVELTAKDECDATIGKVKPTEKKIGTDPKNYIIQRTWTAKDACGNIITHTQKITVKDDLEPRFTDKVLPKEQITVCPNAIPEMKILYAVDGCGNSLGVSVYEETSSPKDPKKGYTKTRTWKVSAPNGKSKTHTQVITVIDNQAPTFVEKLPEKNLEYTCASQVPEPVTLTAEDNCDTKVEVIFDETKKENGTNKNCPNNFTIKRTWKATDTVGNKVEYVQTITVKDDVKPTFVSELPQKELLLSCEKKIPTAEILKFTDNCDKTEKEAKVNDKITTGNCPNNYTIQRTWTAQDLCGNKSTHTQTIKIIDDQKPIFKGELPKQNLTIYSAKEVPPAQELEFTDNCDTTVRKVKAKEEKLKETCPNNFVLKRTWIAKDTCGNQNKYEQIINVADTIAPRIEKSAEDLTVQCDGNGNQTDLQNWLDNYANAVITDNSGKVKWTHNYTGLTKSIGNIGSATVTFTCSDECDNSVTTKATFTIVDTIPPIITKAENKIVECDGKGNLQEYNDWLANNGYATASETCGEITWTNKIEDQTTICLGQTKTFVRFTATDDYGNSSDVVQIFEIRDTTPPTITPAEDLKVECDGNGNSDELQNWLDNHGGATATDLCSENLTWTHDFSGLTDSCTQDTKVTFTITDICGNKSETSAVFSISDTTPPEFVGDLPESEITINPDELTPAPTFTATDICGEAEVVFTENQYNLRCENQSSLERKWTARDLCGNEKIFVQNIHLVAPFEVFNNVSPNGDGINELFYIKGIDCYPDNSVQIFDRTGLRVFNKRGYNNTDKSWNGKDQPEGTYFYTIEYINENNEPIKQKGFIHLEK